MYNLEIFTPRNTRLDGTVIAAKLVLAASRQGCVSPPSVFSSF